jgi:hypothetical protein
LTRIDSHSISPIRRKGCTLLFAVPLCVAVVFGFIAVRLCLLYPAVAPGARLKSAVSWLYRRYANQLQDHIEAR